MGRTGTMRPVLTRRRGVPEQIAWMVALLVLPTLARLLVDDGITSLPFLTFWPSLLIAALILDVPYAVVFSVTAAAVLQHLFGGGGWFGKTTAVRIGFALLFWVSTAMIIGVGAILRRTVNELEAANRQQTAFNSELRHRVHNMLAIIQALAASGPKADNPLDFYREFVSRLDGLSKASDLLRIGTEAEGRLPDVIERTIAPFDMAHRVNLRGVPCVLPDDSCIPLIMALYELGTNATKHGALSQPEGSVDVTWFFGADGTSLYILWKERGGAPVNAPQRQGIGSRLLRAQPGLDAVELTFDRKGVWCEIMIRNAAPGDRRAN